MNLARSKIVYLGEWVKVRNMMNKRFRANGPCAICQRGTCGVVWYSIKTHEVRCIKCFDAEREHWAELERRRLERRRGRTVATGV